METENQFLHCFLLSPKFLPLDNGIMGQLFLAEGTEQNNGQQRFLQMGFCSKDWK